MSVLFFRHPAERNDEKIGRVPLSEKIGPAPLSYDWSAGSDAGVSAPTAWIPVSDGSQPSIKSGELANEAVDSDTWDNQH